MKPEALDHRHLMGGAVKPKLLLDFGMYMKQRMISETGERYKSTTLYTKLHSLRRFFQAYNRQVQLTANVLSPCSADAQHAHVGHGRCIRFC